MIAIRLADILLPVNEPTFVQEGAKLDNFGDWMRDERKFRLCQSLRVALREMQSVSDIDALIHMMEGILATKGEVAEFISVRFRDLSHAARTPGADTATFREDAQAFRDALLSERQRLIRDEIELYSVV